jgi:DNA-binding transcriptional MocR family regulator
VVAVAAKPKFTRIPKITDLVAAGIPTEVVPTYCALADHANNRTGLCWPRMDSLAKTLNRSVRTIQRHLHLLQAQGLIEFVERRRYKGRFSSYLYRILFHATTGHGKPVGETYPNKRRTRQLRIPPKSPTKDVTEGYGWLFGKGEDPPAEEEHKRERNERRSRELEERKEGYEWLFG